MKYKSVGLLIPTLYKIISYHFLLILLEGATMNNHHKITNLNGAPPKLWGMFSKKNFS